MTHLKYLVVGGAMICAFLAVVYVLMSFPATFAAFFFGAIAYGLGWSYYYRQSGQ